MSMRRRQCRHDLEKACLKPRRHRRITSLSCCPGMVYIWRGMGILQTQGFGVADEFIPQNRVRLDGEGAAAADMRPDFLDKLLGGLEVLVRFSRPAVNEETHYQHMSPFGPADALRQGLAGPRLPIAPELGVAAGLHPHEQGVKARPVHQLKHGFRQMVNRALKGEPHLEVMLQDQVTNFLDPRDVVGEILVLEEGYFVSRRGEAPGFPAKTFSALRIRYRHWGKSFGQKVQW